jgi:hypothetical protein
MEEIVIKCRNLKRIELDANIYNLLSKDMKDWKIENNTVRLIYLNSASKSTSANEFV